jgi:hypothetical protein
MLREALDAAWAAIYAAPVPPPGQREQTCRTYQEDTSPVQERLFGDEAPRRPAEAGGQETSRRSRRARPAAARPGGDRPRPAACRQAHRTPGISG